MFVRLRQLTWFSKSSLLVWIIGVMAVGGPPWTIAEAQRSELQPPPEATLPTENRSASESPASESPAPETNGPETIGADRSADAAITLEDIKKGSAQVEGNSDLDDALKASLQEIYRQAEQNIQAAETSKQNQAKFVAMADDVSGQTQAVKDKLNKPQKSSTLEVDGETSIEVIKQQLAAKKVELASAVQADGEWSAERTRRQKRIAEIPVEQLAVDQKLEQVKEQLSRSAPANETPLQTETRISLLRSQLQSLEARKQELVAEQGAYAATTDLLPLQIQLANQKTNQLKETTKKLEAILVERQESKAANTIDDLTAKLSNTPGPLLPLAERNIEIARQNQILVSKLSEATKLLADAQESFVEVKAAKTTSQERLGTVGLTDALGIILREKRAEFEELRTKFRPLPDLREKTQQYQINAFELEDDLAHVREQIESLQVDDGEGSNPNQEEIELWDQRRELLIDTLDTQNTLLQIMLNADTQRRQLRMVIDDYIEFVDQNLFWIRSAPAFSVMEIGRLVPASAWLLNPSHWSSVWRHLIAGAKHQPISSILALLMTLGLIGYRSRLKQGILETGAEASTFHATFLATAKSLGYSIALAFQWPIVFAFIGWLLLISNGTDPLIRGLGMGFVVTAIYVASRELIKDVCRDNGLADSHFGWDKAIRSLLRLHLRWYTAVGGILIFLMIVYHECPDVQWRISVTRITSVFLFGVTALFHHCILSPKSPIYVQARREHPDSVSYRWRRVIWLVATGLPIVFALFALSGYLETAFSLGRLLQTSVLMLVLLLLLTALTFRALSLHYRDVARSQAIERREKRLAATPNAAGEGLASDIGIELEEEEAADLPTLDRNTRQLIYVTSAAITLFSLAYVWSDVLPAINILDRAVFFEVSTGERVEEISLRTLVYVIVTIVGAMFAAKNLPSFLELLILSRTSLDSGARYAMTTIFRYIVITIATIAVLNLLWIPWTQLGWLLAAASVGLGFGMQEIVANFVCGLILLVERPVRVGDIVTIDDTTGVVSRIQMRATTVTNWDRKEFIVPNKTLITDKLLNWSLTNVVNRVTINIGVDYESDTRQVQAILIRITDEHPDVMDDPAPVINFDSFGDSSLNFVVRFYLANLDRRVMVTHEINNMILNEFRAAGISIPFPQRDVHMK
ncbi:Miniconductance mechanosensitive channel MscM precursor [Novipirellula aureliae]|uniref:Miniconductance mechanosensitive channel MscM n=1 Tax=Novipirellula aureliae TaxID=2527966 RepID=A0A5C6DDH8_9BACT|nr:mechanosensitive ion channel domain-containing protein [Novipirellula aureliae]TWU35293.1 Miniconductance mechanosensitive channel MscM precursor [Novipirellula aureliae]